MPRDEPLAPNPPDGAYIDYIVAGGGHAQPVEIAIYDAKGALVNRFSSADHAPAPDLAKLDIAPEWLPADAAPAATPGQHRFVWDLHYAKPLDLGGAAGVWAPPGRYTVRLTVGGASQSQPLEIRPDPRVKVTEDGFEAEFALAREVEQARVRTHAALAEAAKLRADLEARRRTAAPVERHWIDTQIVRLNGITRIPPEDPANAVGLPPQTAAGLSDIAQRLDKLAQAVDGADAAPSPDDVSGVRLAKAALDATLAQLKAAKAEMARPR
jgi:hypothetical protein